MNFYPFEAAGKNAVTLQIKGDYVYYPKATLVGTADDTILITDQGGSNYFLLQPGQGCPAEGGVTDWYIYNFSGVGTIKGTLAIGKGPFTDNRPSGKTSIEGAVNITGTVDTVDGGKSRTLNDRAFIGRLGVAQQVGLIGHIQLWNPATSAKKVIVKKVVLGTGAVAQGMFLFRSTAMMATFNKNIPSKKSGAVFSTAEIRNQATAAQAAGDEYMALQLGATGNIILAFEEPIVLMPGSGIHVAGGLQNAEAIGGFEFFEEPI